MAHYRTHTFATSTARTYKTHLKAYTAFCNLLHIPPLPISQLNLARYIAYLSSRLCYASVKQYLNIVRLLHIESGVANPLGTWYLDSLLRGCRRVMGNTSKPKLPITVELLKKMFSFLNLTLHVDLTFWAVCLVGFFSFLRKSNLLSNSSKAQGVSMLTRGDVSFLPAGVLLRISHSKTVQFGERNLEIPIPHIPNSPLCPSSALLLMCKTQPAHARAPLFTCPSQAGPVAFTYSMFISRLKTCLGRAGVDSDNYAGHSLRRGGASFALACNVPGDLIKLQGDWKSDCYQRYLDPDIQTKFFVAKAMSDKVQSLRVF